MFLLLGMMSFVLELTSSGIRDGIIRLHLDKEMDLKKGFYLNELYDAIDGHVLEKTVLKAKYIKE